MSRHLGKLNDPHGKNSLLATYIQYQSHLPHLDPATRPGVAAASHKQYGTGATASRSYGGDMSLLADDEVRMSGYWLVRSDH